MIHTVSRRSIQGGGLSTYATFASRPRAAEPTVVYASRGGAVGSSVGYGARSVAFAEFECAERFGLASGLQAVRSVPFEEIRDRLFGNACLKAFCQTSGLNEGQIRSSNFDVLSGHEITTGRAIDIPFNLFTLNPNLSDDFMPVADSSGAALHTSPELCFESAFLEFVERQCVNVMWLKRKPLSVTNLLGSRSENVPDVRDARRIVRYLTEAGYIRVFDISYVNGCFVYFAVFSGISPQHEVQYACGVGSNVSSEMALVKSIVELFQGYQLMKELVAQGSIDPSLENYRRFNDMGSIEVFGRGEVVDIREINGRSSGSIEAAISSISSISKNLAYYQSGASRDGNTMVLGKVVSPDFYLHIQHPSGLNYVNKFSEHAGTANLRSREAIPFG